MIAHHPHEATLTAYAAGALPGGMALTVATHLQFCPACRDTAGLAEAMGGALLDSLPPTPVSEDALHRALAMVEDRVMAPREIMPPPVLHADLPPPLNRCAFGGWKPLTPGMWFRPLRLADGNWAGLVKGSAGRVLPAHAHAGSEMTCVLSGAFSDVRGHYRAGDLVEVGDGEDHQPVIDNTGPCLSLIAIERVRLHGVLGFAQRLLGW